MEKGDESAPGKGMTYREAGVDIDKAGEVLARARSAIRSTFTPGVGHEEGSFGGIFSLDRAGVGRGTLVASTDGVGTKVLLAKRMGIHDTVGQDLVNHCIDDILVLGARPLFFLDYLATGRIEPPLLTGLIAGLVRACRENGLALLGGETAEMPGIYREGDFDLAGTIVGIVPPEGLVTGKEIAPGDRLLALPSTGLHTNGYSLARKILFEKADLGPDHHPQGWKQSVGEALLAVHRSYLEPVGPLLEAFPIKGMAHITGGGLPDNLPRILPAGCRARIETGTVPVPPICEFLVRLGRVSRKESYRVFNMGFGFLLVVAPDQLEPVADHLQERGEEVYPCGEIIAGERGVELLP